MENEMGPGSICGPVVYNDSGFLRSEVLRWELRGFFDLKGYMLGTILVHLKNRLQGLGQ